MGSASGKRTVDREELRQHDRPGLHAQLTELARPWLHSRLANPTVSALLRGTLDHAVMRRWLEQDYLYLHTYARVFASLAAKAPDRHMATFIDGAHYTIHTEVQRLIELADLFGADFTSPVMGPACTGYTQHLSDSARRYESGAISVLPCMIGFATLGLTIELPEEPRFRRWIEIYSSGDFQEYATRYAALVDDLEIDAAEAADVFQRGMQFEVDLWDEASDFVAAQRQVRTSPAREV